MLILRSGFARRVTCIVVIYDILVYNKRNKLDMEGTNQFPLRLANV